MKCHLLVSSGRNCTAKIVDLSIKNSTKEKLLRVTGSTLERESVRGSDASLKMPFLKKNKCFSRFESIVSTFQTYSDFGGFNLHRPFLIVQVY